MQHNRLFTLKLYFLATLLIIVMNVSFLLAAAYYKPTIGDPVTEKWRWKHFTELDGKGIRCMTDGGEKHTVWFGVNKGVLSYNGSEWQRFFSDSLFGKPVTALFTAKNGDIYAGSEKGINIYRNANWQKLLPEYKLPAMSITAIIELRDGTMLFSTDSGLLQLTNNHYTFYASEKTISRFSEKYNKINFVKIADNLLINNNFHVSTIYEDRDNRIWVGVGYVNARSGKICLAAYNKNKKLSFKLYHSEDPKGAFYKGLSFFQTSDGKIWVATDQFDKKIFYFNDGNPTPHYISYNFDDEWSHWNMIETPDHSFWVGAHAGKLFIRKNGKWHKYRFPDIPMPTTNRVVLFKGKDNSIWLIARQNRVYHLDYTGRRWTVYENLIYQCEDKSKRNWFISIDSKAVVNKGKEWIAYNKNDGLIDTPVRLINTSKNIIWAAGSHNGVAATAWFDGKRWHKQLHPKLSWGIDYRSVLEAKDGSLWFGCGVDIQKNLGQTGGILRLMHPNEDNEQWIHYKVPGDEQSSYGLAQSKDGTIWQAGIISTYFNGERWEKALDPVELTDHTNHVAATDSGDIWFGSRIYGMLHFDGQSWTHYTTDDGLKSNSITFILAESDSSVIVATSDDICRFDGQKWNTDIFPSELNMTHEGGSIFRSSNGNLWINSAARDWKRRSLTGQKTRKEAFENFRTALYKPDKMHPTTEITYFDKKVSQPGNAFLSWKGYDPWEITPTNRLQYSYRMDGDEWTPFDYKTSNLFLSLPTGEHTFEVRARDWDFNIAEKPAGVTFIVEPPFWLKAEFLIPIFILLIISVYLAVHVIRRGKRLQENKNETDNILNNVEEGLFLLNNEFIIGEQYSAILDEILEQKDLAKVDFLSVLKDKITDDHITDVKNYLDLLFQNEVAEDILDELNPLSEVKFLYNNGMSHKYLTFRFRRIFDENQSTLSLIVTVRDITEQVTLSLKLKESKEEENKQINWLLNLLNVEPQMLQEFIMLVNEEIRIVKDNLSLKASEIDEERLNTIYRAVHSIKGNASLLGLNFFAQLAHHFEEELFEIRKKGSVSESQVSSLKHHLSALTNSLNIVNNLLKKISDIHKHMRMNRSYENKRYMEAFERLVAEQSRDLRKKIRIDSDNFDINVIPRQDKFLVRDIIVQSLRNSVAHGIELPQEREKAGKEAEGIIEIKTFKTDNTVGIIIRDDGRGLQIDKIKEKVIKSGKWSAEEVNQWDEKRISMAIFDAGISTSDSANMISGRGVGMDIIKNKVKTKNGTIEINFEKGKFTEFIYSFQIEEDAKKN